MKAIYFTIAFLIFGGNAMANIFDEVWNDEQIQAKEKSLIKKHEGGFRDKIYLDTADKPRRTVGYGFNIDDATIRSFMPTDVVNGKRLLTQPEADEIFDKIFRVAETDAELFAGSKTFYDLNPVRQYVLKDMAYNLGLRKLQGFQEMQKALRKGDYEEAANQMIDSKWYKQVGNRSKFLVDLMRNG